MFHSKFTFKKVIFLIGLLTVLVISFFSFSTFKSYNTPTLIGKWKSLETGEKISFTSDGLVTFKNTSKTGSYTLLSSSQMEYTIDDKTFTMSYSLGGRRLSWGIQGEEPEVFTKNFIF